MAKTQWWALQEVGMAAPYGVAALVSGDNLPRRYVPGEGLVHWPELAAEMFMGESGAHQITHAEAMTLMRSARPVSAKALTRLRGKAPTIPVSM